MNHQSTHVRLAEVVASLSIATDLGMGQPLEFALASCILSVRLAEKLGYSETALREVYYQSLLRYIGCNVDTHLVASVAGDETVLRQEFAPIDNANLVQIMGMMVRTVQQTHQGQSPLELAQSILRGLVALPQIRESFSGHCEVAQRLASRLGFESNVIYALGQLYERWDGKGTPKGLKGETIAPAVLVVTLAQDMLFFYRLGGLESALSIARKRSGRAYAPQVVEGFCQHAQELLGSLEGEPVWETVLALEPGSQNHLSPAELETAFGAMADFVDIKSVYTLGHSSRVANLAAKAAEHAGLPISDVQNLRYAGLVHNLGRTGVSAGIWDKPGKLSGLEWEKVRLYPYHTERILRLSRPLAGVGILASAHQERLDGSGYHRGLSGQALSASVRILAAADVFQALTEARPHRPALSLEAATAELKQAAKNKQLDETAVQCVLAAAGQASVKRQIQPAGLSPRELEVLRLVVQGQSTKQIAKALAISTKTADHHIQHIYNKIGVSTRAGATVFALEQGLV